MALYWKFLECQQATCKGEVQEKQKKRFEIVEKRVVWALVVFILVFLSIYVASLAVTFDVIRDQASTSCTNPLQFVRLIGYGVVFVGLAIVSIRFIILFRELRNEIWKQHRQFFLFTVLGLATSIMIKGTLMGTASIFYQSQNSQTPGSDVALGTKFVYILVAFLFAGAELGYTFVWLLIRESKTHEFYTELNYDQWGGRLSMY